MLFYFYLCSTAVNPNNFVEKLESINQENGNACASQNLSINSNLSQKNQSTTLQHLDTCKFNKQILIERVISNYYENPHSRNEINLTSKAEVNLSNAGYFTAGNYHGIRKNQQNRQYKN